MTTPFPTAQATVPGLADRSAETPLCADEIELINAHGPFNHSVWSGRGVTVTHEEGMTGRVEFVSARLREVITRLFSDQQLAQMSIVDVGCYDGWLLESLSDLPFSRMLGIEPRAQNIERGRYVREVLGLSSRVQYRLGEVGTLDDKESFDIVLCMGVLHHLDSIASGLQDLRSVCRRLLIFDTVCLSSECLTPALKQELELKDVVYQFRPHIFGMTAQKFEGQYYPGSGVRFSVVNVPTLESLYMHLDVLGFDNVHIVADKSDYQRAMPLNTRPFRAICLSAEVDPARCRDAAAEEAKWIADYEARLVAEVLPEELIVPLHDLICAGRTPQYLPWRARLLHLSLQGPKWTRGVFRRTALYRLANPTQREIVAAFSHCPVDKIRLEFGKLLLARGAFDQAAVELQRITQRVNADWRCAYRAFYLLWRAATALQDQPTAARYRRYCLTCNPHFPARLFDAPPPFAPQHA